VTQPTLPLHLLTERLLLRAPMVAFAPAVNAFQLRNRTRFAPWDPPYAENYFEPEGVCARLTRSAQDFATGNAYCYWLSRNETPTELIGKINVTQVNRGAFQSAAIGYALDGQALGQGLMAEGLRAVIAQMFDPQVGLHRLQAAVRPENLPSLAVLKRLGFTLIGLSPRYLFINGRWCDHEIYALINPDWRDDRAP
jgi:ribosomal-protein-alanine N-acetyltransferase